MKDTAIRYSQLYSRFCFADLVMHGTLDDKDIFNILFHYCQIYDTDFNYKILS